MMMKALVSTLPVKPRKVLQKVHYRRKLANAQIDAEPELQVVSDLIEMGDTVFDIGANFGLFTKFMSVAAGPTGQVHSFEPTADIHEALAHNVESLGMENVTTNKVALSNHIGDATFHIPKNPDGSLNYYEASLEAHTVDEPLIRQTITTTTLDQYVTGREIDRIDFLKIDVEGHELSLLDGARQTLAKHRPTIFIEINEPLDDGAHGSAVRLLAEELGYQVHTCTDGQIQPWEPGQNEVNYLLLPA